MKGHGLIDEIIPEPQGGAHRDVSAATQSVKESLVAALNKLDAMPMGDLLERRYQRLMSYGVFAE